MVVTTNETSTLGVNTTWTAPRVVLGLYDGGFIPKMLSNRMIVLSSGEWALPYWSDNQVLNHEVH
jgi:hypothetical protein